MFVARVRLAALVAAALLAVPAAAYHVSCDYYCYATASDGVPVGDNQTYTGQTYVDGSYSNVGGQGNYGSASFVVDLMNVTVGAVAHAHGVEYQENDFEVGNGRIENASFQDRLVFTVPAGTYPDGAYATLRGRTVGSLGSTIGAGAQGQCYASFGPETYNTGLMNSGIDEATNFTLDETWFLVLELVAPGTPLAAPSIQAHQVELAFFNGITWAVEYKFAPGDWRTGDGDIAFADGLRFTALTVTPGVTWVSDSGIFAGGLSGA